MPPRLENPFVNNPAPSPTDRKSPYHCTNAIAETCLKRNKKRATSALGDFLSAYIIGEVSAFSPDSEHSGYVRDAFWDILGSFAPLEAGRANSLAELIEGVRASLETMTEVAILCI